MKAKLVRESLNESENFDEKDLQRIQDIESKPYNAQDSAAEKMAKLIKDPQKALRRYYAAKELNLENKRIADIFLAKAVDLGNEEAKQIKKDEWDNYLKKVKERVITKQDAKMPLAEKIAAAINKAVPIAKASVSRTCHHPYWNNEGLFVDINGFLGDDAPYSGYNVGGPDYITNYRKQVLGKNLYKIASVVRRFHDQGVDLVKEIGHFFVKIKI